MVCDSILVSRSWFMLVMFEQLALLAFTCFIWGYYVGKKDKKKALKEERKTKRRVKKNADNTHHQED